MTVDEIAERQRWSTKRVRQLIHQGLPTVRIGRQHLINTKTLDTYLRERERFEVKAGEHPAPVNPNANRNAWIETHTVQSDQPSVEVAS